MSDLTTIFLALIGMGALFAWVACLLVGCRLLSPDLAIAIGVSGLWIGWLVFRKLGLPTGPTLYGIEVVPGLVGTTIVLVACLIVRAVYDRRKAGAEPPLRRDIGGDRDVPRFLRER